MHRKRETALPEGARNREGFPDGTNYEYNDPYRDPDGRATDNGATSDECDAPTDDVVR